MKKTINFQMFEPPKQSSEDLDISKLANDAFREYFIDLSKEYPDIAYTMTINGIPCFPRGDIQALKGKAKQGKTHVGVIFMVASLRGEFLEIQSKIKNAKICYFATEEHERSVHRLVKKIHRLCKWSTKRNNKRFLAYSIRREGCEKRKEIIQQIIHREKPDIVFIDGIRDLVYDFNNTKEAFEIMNFLMKLSSEQDCAIINVLHTNKQQCDTNMRGHLGTELENKSSDILEVTKFENKYFLVQQTECRNESTGSWGFSLDMDGLPKPVNNERLKDMIENKSKSTNKKTSLQINQQKAALRINRMKENFSKILSDEKRLSNSALKTEYMKIAQVKEDAANKHIKEMVENNFIMKTEDKKYKLSL